jgi:tRNA modification GTPase
VDEVLVTAWRDGSGYTGEEACEIGCHGAPVVIKAVLSALESAGFRAALPGEFTFRAFRNGKVDLPRAQAVAELASARTDAARSGALARLAGSVSIAVASIRDALVEALATVELSLDYAEDDGEDAPFPSGALERALASIESLLAGYAVERAREVGARVALVGRTNAGKSSLFNSMLKIERAIVSDEPGTTRDWLEATCDAGGVPLRLVDTAGLRGDPTGEVEHEGQRRSRLVAEESEVVVYVVDSTAGITADDEAWLRDGEAAVLAWNKVDAEGSRPAPDGWVPVSARTMRGVDALVGRILASIGAGDSGAPTGESVAEDYQRELLESAKRALHEALDGAAAGFPADALALDVRAALAAIDELSGASAPFDALAEIFSRFCVGK